MANKHYLTMFKLFVNFDCCRSGNSFYPQVGANSQLSLEAATLEYHQCPVQLESRGDLGQLHSSPTKAIITSINFISQQFLLIILALSAEIKY